MTLATGQVLQNRYRVVSLLKEGGMGAVYRAWDTRLNVPVALKEMTPQPGLDARTLTQLRRQFQQEATVLARLDHPHLVDVTDFFEEEGNGYLVMKLIEGENLAEIIERRGALPEEEALVYADQLLDALAHCHAQGVIHRDVKPQNVIIRPVGPAPPRLGGAGGGAVLVDFGLVKLWDPDDPHTKTAMRGMGTPEYAPPEQYDVGPGRHTDPRSDIYGLGATLYHALTGQSPPTVTQRIASRSAFQPPRTLNKRISPATEAALLRAMELAVEDRFPTPQEMAAALGGEAPAPTHPAVAPKRQPTKMMPGARAAAPIQRKRVPVWAWALGGLAVLVLVVGLAIGMGEMGDKSTPTPPTRGTATAAVPASVKETPTPSPTATPTHTLTPTAKPTATPTHTPVATRTPVPRATPPTLLRPAQGLECRSPLLFQWQGFLSAGQTYQVTAYHVASHYTQRSDLLTTLSWTADLPADKFGEWRWRVSVIQGGVEIATSGEWMFWFDPFASPLPTPSP